MVFPKPEDLKIRSVKRFKEMGKEVPADAVNNMLGFPLHRLSFKVVIWFLFSQIALYFSCL